MDHIVVDDSSHRVDGTNMNVSTEGMLKRLRHVPWTIECGIHSGIPWCCVKFYVVHWMFSDDGDELRIKHRKLMARWGMALVGYIPCGACCRIGHRAFVKSCPDS